MSLVEKYRIGNNHNTFASSIEIDNLATLESIKQRQGWMIAAQIATVASIVSQTNQTNDALRLVNDNLTKIEGTIQDGFNNLEQSIERLESNLIENLNEIKWYLFNVDKKLDNLINLVRFSGATKSAELNKQGFILYKIGYYSDAINQLNKSLQENPLNLEAYINLGFVYLREEKLEESILNFEKASKLINEDFSYFEEVSQDKLKSTEIFIYDNLATLYSLSEQYSKSIEALNKILNYDIDLKTEIISKYKLSRANCLSGDYDASLKVITELIDKQYFEAVSIAVTNKDFEPISKDILLIIKNKLESSKKSFINYSNTPISTIQSHEIDANFKQSLVEIVSRINDALSESSNYSLLLSLEFKEHHHEFLSLIVLFSELKSKIEKDLNSIAINTNKLESISKYNDTIDDSLSSDMDVITLSHKLLLSKIKSNVKSEIERKLKESNVANTIYLKMSKNLEKQFLNIQKKSGDELLSFLNSDFSIESCIKDLIIQNKPSKSDDNEELFEEKIINEYNNFLSKYKSSNKSSSMEEHDEKSSLNDEINFYKNKIELITKALDMTFDEVYELSKNNKDLLLRKIKLLPLAQQFKILAEF